MRERLRQIPRPLALLLPVVALFGVAWVLIVPAWGNPDEEAHFSYTQTLAERGELPGDGENVVSSELRTLMDFANTDETTFFPTARPEWSEATELDWQGRQEGAPRDDGGAHNATVEYPPAYYLYELVPYALAEGGTIVDRLYLARLFSVLWLLVTTVAAWLLAGEVFGRDRRLQLVTAAAVGLWPMVGFVSASVNPDAMLVALWALATWLGVSLLKSGPNAARAAGLCLCLGLALVTKASAFALVPPVAFVLVLVAIQAARRLTLRRLATGAAVLAVLAAPVAAWFAVAHSEGRPAYGQRALVSTAESEDPPEVTGGEDEPSQAKDRQASAGEFASYLWQFYLPRLSSQERIQFMFPVVSSRPATQLWIAGSWGNFGWSNVWFPQRTYLIFGSAVALALFLLSITAGRALRRGAWRRRTVLLTGAFFLLLVGALVGGLHWTDFNMYLRDDPPFLQGRYLLPLAPIFALALAQSTRALPARLQPAAHGAVLAGLLVLQLACLGLVTSRFYG
jgi:4-amino-4-deoxy-L-arabinose transferase-like glycosyltransferase